MEKFLPLVILTSFIQLATMFYFSLVLGDNLTQALTLLEVLKPNFTNFCYWKHWKSIFQASLLKYGLGAFITLGSNDHFRALLYQKSVYFSLLDMSVTYLYSIMMGIFLNGTLVESQKNILMTVIPQNLIFMPGCLNFWVLMWFSNLYFIGNGYIYT